MYAVGEQPMLAVQLVTETQIAKMHNTGLSACCANELNALMERQLQKLTQSFVESVAWLVCVAMKLQITISRAKSHVIYRRSTTSTSCNRVGSPGPGT